MTHCKLIIQDEVNVKLENLPVEIRRKLVNKLKYEIPYARHTPQYKLGRWDGTMNFFGIGGTGYLNHLDIIIETLENNGIQIDEIEDNRKNFDISFSKIDENFWGDTCWPAGHPHEGEPIRLREHQINAINTFLENPQCLQEIATSAGKTLITATLSKIVEKVGRSIVIVPNKSLVTQTEHDYKNCGLDVGVYFGERKELNKTHTICTWQSLNILDKKNKNGDEILSLAEFLEDVQTVIVDECHTLKADIIKKLLTQNIRNSPIRWGLTGTIPKEDFEKQSLIACIGPVVGQVSAKELQERGVISNCHINIIQTKEFRAFKNYQEEIKYLVTDPTRVNYIASMINNMKTSGNTLVLVDRISAGEELKKLIPGSVFVKGNVKLSDRQNAYDEINSGTNHVVIATYGVASVGINIPRIFNLVLIEPGKSFVRVIQSIGRGIRKAKDKDFVQVWDICSSCKFSKRHLTKRKSYYAEVEYPYTIQKVDY